MDSITHLVVGATVGHLIAGKSLGNKALLYGAIANSIPDIDVTAALWLPTDQNLLAHRGFTHSILFQCLLAPILAVCADRWHRLPEMPLKKWLILFLSLLLLHPLMDCMNSYGTGIFEPFSHQRVSFNLMFVADPLFTLWPLLACVGFLVFRKKEKAKNIIAACAISISLVYCIYAGINKFRIDSITRETLKSNSTQYGRYFTTPTPFNVWLWYIVVETKDGFQIGYRSVFDTSEKVSFTFFTRGDVLPDSIESSEEIKNLVRFSQNYYSAVKKDNAIVFVDLRFGQIDGWRDPYSPFIFQFDLIHPGENAMVIQRGRLSPLNKDFFNAFITRIRGKEM